MSLGSIGRSGLVGATANWEFVATVRMAILATVLTLFSASPLLAQDLFGITIFGDLIRIDKTTGTGALVGSSGFLGTNAAASDSSGRIFSIKSLSGGFGQLIEFNPTTGDGSVFLELPGCSSPLDVRGMAFDSTDTLYVVLDRDELDLNDVLATIDMVNGQCSEIGDMLQDTIQALAFDADDNLFCLSVFFLGGLCRVNATTGAVTSMSFGSFPDSQALEFDEDGTLFAARSNLLRLDPVSGSQTLVGPTGFNDIRGLAFGPTPPTPPVQVVKIDIKPGSDPNCINNDGNGKIAVAILGSADFDAAQVDPSTVLLEGLPVAMNGNGTDFQARLKDVDRDDFTDLLVQIEDIAGAFEPSDEIAILTGELFDGTAIEGSDSICLVQ